MFVFRKANIRFPESECSFSGKRTFAFRLAEQKVVFRKTTFRFRYQTVCFRNMNCLSTNLAATDGSCLRTLSAILRAHRSRASAPRARKGPMMDQARQPAAGARRIDPRFCLGCTRPRLSRRTVLLVLSASGVVQTTAESTNMWVKGSQRRWNICARRECYSIPRRQTKSSLVGVHCAQTHLHGSTMDFPLCPYFPPRLLPSLPGCAFQDR